MQRPTGEMCPMNRRCMYACSDMANISPMTHGYNESTPVNANHPRLSPVLLVRSVNVHHHNIKPRKMPLLLMIIWMMSSATPDIKCMERGVYTTISVLTDEEGSIRRERIPGGLSSWREFFHRFMTCAKANQWSAATMTVQLRFCLLGAAGAVVHKKR